MANVDDDIFKVKLFACYVSLLYERARDCDAKSEINSLKPSAILSFEFLTTVVILLHYDLVP